MGLSFGEAPLCSAWGLFYSSSNPVAKLCCTPPRDPSKAVCACVCPSSEVLCHHACASLKIRSNQDSAVSSFPSPRARFFLLARRQLAAYPTRTIDVSVAPFMCHSTKLRSRRRFPLPSASLDPCRPKPFRLLLCGRARLCCITKLLHAGSGSSRDFVARRKHPPHHHHDA